MCAPRILIDYQLHKALCYDDEFGSVKGRTRLEKNLHLGVVRIL